MLEWEKRNPKRQQADPGSGPSSAAYPLSDPGGTGQLCYLSNLYAIGKLLLLHRCIF